DLFDVIDPEYTTDEHNAFTQIYAKAQGALPAGTAESFKNIISQAGFYIIGSGQTISFKEDMPLISELKDLNIILASALYKAVLPFEDIKVMWRKPSSQPVPGVEAGFEVSLEDDGDLKFLNDSAYAVTVIFQVNDNNEWIMALAGKPGLKAGEIKTEETKITPPVIYSQDNTLPEKEQRVVEPGKDGLSVKVYRVINGEPAMLYEDVYPPVERVISIGSGVTKAEIVK
ncbi:MAG TPA: G5 domain-containing protein, partial [Clostridia bacterium]